MNGKHWSIAHEIENLYCVWWLCLWNWSISISFFFFFQQCFYTFGRLVQSICVQVLWRKELCFSKENSLFIAYLQHGNTWMCFVNSFVYRRIPIKNEAKSSNDEKAQWFREYFSKFHMYRISGFITILIDYLHNKNKWKQNHLTDLSPSCSTWHRINAVWPTRAVTFLGTSKSKYGCNDIRSPVILPVATVRVTPATKIILKSEQNEWISLECGGNGCIKQQFCN